MRDVVLVQNAKKTTVEYVIKCSFYLWFMWHDKGLSFQWVWMSASQRTPLPVLAWNPHKEPCARDFLRDRKKTREGKVPGHSTEASQEKSREDDSVRGAAARRGVGSCGLRSQVSQRKRMRQRSYWLCRDFARIHARDSPQKHRTLGKCQKTPSSCAWS